MNNTDSTTDEEGNEQARELGLMLARGPLLVQISPMDGTEQIDNPWNVEVGSESE